MRRLLLYSIAALGALAAAESRGAFVTGSLTNGDGTFPFSFGDVGPLAIGGHDFHNLGGSFAGGDYSFTVQSYNLDFGRSPELNLYGFRLFSTRPETVTFSISMVQDFVVAPSASWAGGSGFGGSATFTNAGQSASVSVDTTHESTHLPTRSQSLVASAPGSVPLSAPLVLDPVAPVDGVYRISTSLTVQVTRGAAGSVLVQYPSQDFTVSWARGQVPAPGVLLVISAAPCTLARRRRRSLTAESAPQRGAGVPVNPAAPASP